METAGIFNISRVPVTNYRVEATGRYGKALRDPVFERSLSQMAISLGFEAVIYLSADKQKQDTNNWPVINFAEEWIFSRVDVEKAGRINGENPETRVQLEYNQDLLQRNGFKEFIKQLHMVAGQKLSKYIYIFPATERIPDGTFKKSIEKQGIKGFISLPVKNEFSELNGYVLLLGLKMPLWWKIYTESLLEQVIYIFQNYTWRVQKFAKEQEKEARKLEMSKALVRYFTRMINSNTKIEKELLESYTSLLSKYWEIHQGKYFNALICNDDSEDFLLKAINSTVFYSQMDNGYVVPQISPIYYSTIHKRYYKDWAQKLTISGVRLRTGEIQMPEYKIIYIDIELLMVVMGCFTDYFLKQNHAGIIEYGIRSISGYIVFYLEWVEERIEIEKGTQDNKYLSTNGRKIMQIEDLDSEGSGLELSIAGRVASLLGGELRIDARTMPGLKLEFMYPAKSSKKNGNRNKEAESGQTIDSEFIVPLNGHEKVEFNQIEKI